MYFNIKCIGKFLGPTNEFERSLVFETGEFVRSKFDCILLQGTFLCVLCIAPDKAAYCIFTQFRGPENAIKLISVRTKTQ